MKAKKPRKPQDGTMRNVRAANKRIKALESDLRDLRNGCVELESRILALERFVLPKGEIQVWTYTRKQPKKGRK